LEWLLAVGFALGPQADFGTLIVRQYPKSQRRQVAAAPGGLGRLDKRLLPIRQRGL
jgi:hypothetical protein